MSDAARLRVLMLAHAYPRYQNDPVGSFIGNLAVALRGHGVDVVVSAPSAPGLARHEVIDGIPVHRFRYAPRGRETLAYTGTMGAQVKETLGGKLAMASYLASATIAARRLVHRERARLVHAHWWFPGGLVAATLAGTGGPPFVTTLHGSDLRLATMFPMGEGMFASVSRAAARVTAVSSWLARGAHALVPDLGVQVAPMPVLTSLFDPAADGERDVDRLLFVGKLSPQKGLDRLLRAMARMQQRARLTVVGAGRVDDAHLMELARELGLAERITWLPLLSQADLAVQYRRAAVHVIPALDEGLGLTAVESLLSETPVVAFESGGVPDVVLHDRTGLLVPPGDEPALAAALDALLADGARRAAMGRAGREHAIGTFGADAVARGYAALYAAAVRQASADPDGDSGA